MKKFSLLFILISIILLTTVNFNGIIRDFRRLHLFDSEYLVKSSSFQQYTVDVFQENDKLTIKIYSSFSWFEDKTDVTTVATALEADDITVVWNRVQLKNNIVAVMLYVEAESEGVIHHAYDAYFSESDKFDVDDFFTLQEIDIKENPSQVD